MPKEVKKESATKKPAAKKQPKVEAVAPARKPAASKKTSVAASAPAASSTGSTPKTTHAQPEPTVIHTPPATLAHHEVAERAYYLWAERGWQHGESLSDWLRAEEQLNTRKAA